MSELIRRPCPQRETTFFDSHLKVETDISGNDSKERLSGKGSVRKRDVVYAFLHALAAIALIHAYINIIQLSANKDAGQRFSTIILLHIDSSMKLEGQQDGLQFGKIFQIEDPICS